MKILARCNQRVLVHASATTVAEVQLGEGVEDQARTLFGTRQLGRTTEVTSDLDALEVYVCGGCKNYGPQGSPKGDEGAFQQFALQWGSHPWGPSEPRWLCMLCSMPPR